MRDAVLYSDFNCPFCYALEERLAGLGLSKHVKWRGVEHAPALPIPMTLTPRLSRELNQEVEMIHRLVPETSIAPPPGKPNTHPAERAVAAAFLLDPEKAQNLKASVYRAFWSHGDDISLPEVLERLAREAGFDAVPSNDAVDTMLHEWRESWLRSTTGGVPFLVADDGQQLMGLHEAKDVLRFFEGSPAEKSLVTS